ncbi:hypothetical protein THAOC_35440, partial [Thalassiosira oceanica]
PLCTVGVLALDFGIVNVLIVIDDTDRDGLLRDEKIMDSYPADLGDVGEVAPQKPAAKMKGAEAKHAHADVLTSTRNTAPRIAVRRKKQRKNSASRASGGNKRLRTAADLNSSTNFPLVVLLLLSSSFTTNLAVTAERDGRHTANYVNDGDGDTGAGSFERILQGEDETSGLFDHSNQPSGLNEGAAAAESAGGAEPASGGGVDGVDEEPSGLNEGTAAESAGGAEPASGGGVDGVDEEPSGLNEGTAAESAGGGRTGE